MSGRVIKAHAMQLAERIELKGLERGDQFSMNPLAFPAGAGGTIALFRFGAATFIGMNPIEEEEVIRGLQHRLIEPLAERESETASLLVRSGSEDHLATSGSIEFKNDAPECMLLVAEALAGSVVLGYAERRISEAFDRVGPIASSLKNKQLLAGSQADLMAQIGKRC